MKRKNKFIYPYRENGKLIGYMVAVPSGVDKRQFKLFYKNNYDSLTDTKDAARVWRDKFLNHTKQCHRLYNNLRVGIPHTHANIKSVKTPIIGVTFSTMIKKYGVYHAWVAFSNLALTHKKVHFSVNKYGHIQAFLLACEFRYRNSGKLIIKDINLLPCKIRELKFPYKILNR